MGSVGFSRALTKLLKSRRLSSMRSALSMMSRARSVAAPRTKAVRLCPCRSAAARRSSSCSEFRRMVRRESAARRVLIAQIVHPVDVQPRVDAATVGSGWDYGSPGRVAGLSGRRRP